MALSDNIRCRRTELKLSQEAVAERLGVSRQAVSKWETGQSEPSAEKLMGLAALFEISLAELIDPQGVRQVQNEAERRVHHTKMRVGRSAGYILLYIGYSGFSGFFSQNTGLAAYYWLVIALVGIGLLLFTSLELFKKRSLQKGQCLLGALLLFAILWLPRIFPFEAAGLPFFVGSVSTALLIAALDILYWRKVWKI